MLFEHLLVFLTYIAHKYNRRRNLQHSSLHTGASFMLSWVLWICSRNAQSCRLLFKVYFSANMNVALFQLPKVEPALAFLALLSNASVCLLLCYQTNPPQLPSSLLQDHFFITF